MPATVATAEVSIGTTGQQNGSVHLCADGSSPLLEPRTIGKPSAAVKRSSSTAGAGATPKQQISYMHSSSVYPALLVFLCPFFVMLFSYTIVKLDGSPTALLQEIRQKGIGKILYSAWVPYIFGSTKAWKFILPYAMFQLALMKILPGKLTKGPITPAGNIPIYRANGMLAYLVTLTTYFVCAYILKLFNPADIYDHYLEFIGAMNVLSLIFCFGIYLKGRFIPSTTDCGASGNFIFDYYWGTELYPRILDWDIKMFTNCRFGMMGWPLLILSYAAKQYETHGLSDSMIVAVALQLIYITKFFHWEMGYMKSLDIMHDRAGFYLCWGCFVWLPSIYTSHTLYLTNHPNDLGLSLAAIIFAIGGLSIYLNYNADWQREKTRNTNGNCTIWGRKPDVIRATYHTTEGEEKNSLLLVSGWWGVSRHFHYIPELLAALCWTLPALFLSPTPYFYFVFLFLLLTHRAIRDDKRCAEKYGKFWDLYCSKVPSKILPFIF